MIKTYEEALQKLNDIRDYLKIARADECVEELDSVAKYFINERNQPTLEELIKEWEDDGFKFEKIFCYQLINAKDDTEIYFNNDQRGLWCNIIGLLSSKQLIRLILTFVALGWEVN